MNKGSCCFGGGGATIVLAEDIKMLAMTFMMFIYFCTRKAKLNHVKNGSRCTINVNQLVHINEIYQCKDVLPELVDGVKFPAVELNELLAAIQANIEKRHIRLVVTNMLLSEVTNKLYKT